MELTTGLEPATYPYQGSALPTELGEHIPNHMERVMGIEPTSLAWKAKVIPIYDTRNFLFFSGGGSWIRTNVLRENGFTVRRL